MSKASDALAAIGIVNPHEVARKGRVAGVPPVFLTYMPYDDISRRGACWQVEHLTEKTDPTGPYWHHGRKAFATSEFPRATSAQERAAARDAAIAWTNERYGTDEWATVPGVYGTALFPKPVADHIKGLLRDARKAGA